MTASNDVRAGLWGEMRRIQTKALILISALLLPACGTVEEGHRGIKLVWGAAEGETPLEPGLHGYNIFTSSIKEVNVQERKFEQVAMAATKDQQMVSTTVAVNFSPSDKKVIELYREIGGDPEKWEQTVLMPQIQEVIKSVTAEYTALELVTKRPEVKGKVTEELIARITRNYFNVPENGVSITDFKFSDAYMAAIEAKQVAEQDAERAQNELDKNELEVQKIEQQAEAERKAAISKAKGEAESLRIRAEAAAEWHKIVGAAATKYSLRHKEIERWDGKAPQFVGEAGMLLPTGG